MPKFQLGQAFYRGLGETESKGDFPLFYFEISGRTCWDGGLRVQMRHCNTTEQFRETSREMNSLCPTACTRRVETEKLLSALRMELRDTESSSGHGTWKLGPRDRICTMGSK